MTGPSESFYARERTVIGPVLFVFCLLDFLGPPLVFSDRSETWLAPLLGAVAGQFGLVAIWAALGPGRWLVRLPASFGVMLLLAWVLALGMLIAAAFGPPLEEALFLPLFFLAPQPPLWIVRLVGGWRIVRASELVRPGETASRQFRLLDLFGVTIVLAITLGLASLGLPKGGDVAQTWLPLLLPCVLWTAWSAFSTLPCLWACFLARNKGASTAAIAAYLVVMTLVLVWILGVVSGSAPRFEVVAVVFLFHAGLAGTMLGVLHVFRVGGYVLDRAGRKRRSLPGQDASEHVDQPKPASPFGPREPR